MVIGRHSEYLVNSRYLRAWYVVDGLGLTSFSS
jgi:hypothetical protein